MNDEVKSDEPSPTRVGYCNPPEHTRFRAGRSGNPKGRPRGTLNMATVLERALRDKVVVNENGKRKTVTKLEAAVKQLMNKAASGDLKALQLLAGLVRSVEKRALQVPAAASDLDESDEKVVLRILQRLETTGQGDQENVDDPNT